MGEDRVNNSDVTCYSGHTYAEEPRHLIWGGRRYVVDEVLARWRTPAGPAFRVRAGGSQYLLSYDEQQDRWDIQPILDVSQETNVNQEGTSCPR